MKIEFFMAMNPPTVTHQMQKVGIRNGKPFLYDPPDLADARAKLCAHLGLRAPAKKIDTGVRLTVKWCFPCGNHKDGEYRTTRPDTDNLQKLLKDCMTQVGYWTDDALVASEICEKFWAKTPGIYIRIETLGDAR